MKSGSSECFFRYISVLGCTRHQYAWWLFNVACSLNFFPNRSFFLHISRFLFTISRIIIISRFVGVQHSDCKQKIRSVWLLLRDGSDNHLCGESQKELSVAEWVHLYSKDRFRYCDLWVMPRPTTLPLRHFAVLTVFIQYFYTHWFLSLHARSQRNGSFFLVSRHSSVASDEISELTSLEGDTLASPHGLAKHHVRNFSMKFVSNQ